METSRLVVSYAPPCTMASAAEQRDALLVYFWRLVLHHRGLCHPHTLSPSQRRWLGFWQSLNYLSLAALTHDQWLPDASGRIIATCRITLSAQAILDAAHASCIPY